MTPHEYKTLKGDGLPAAEVMTKLSEEGWELVTIIPYGPFRDPMDAPCAVYLRRPLRVN